MKCVLCKQGDTRPGLATASLTREGTTVVIKDVPAHICANCGEQYYDEDVTKRLLEMAREAARSGLEVGVRHYQAA